MKSGYALLAMAAFAALAPAATSKPLTSGADPLGFIQGEWVSRHEDDDTRLVVSGNAIKLVAPNPKASSLFLRLMNSGETIATIGGVKSDAPDPGLSPPLRKVVWNGNCTKVQGVDRQRVTGPCEIKLVGTPPLPLRRAKNKIGQTVYLAVSGFGEFYVTAEKPLIMADYYAYSAE